jgi:hypothetical protein
MCTWYIGHMHTQRERLGVLHSPSLQDTMDYVQCFCLWGGGSLAVSVQLRTLLGCSLSSRVLRTLGCGLHILSVLPIHNRTSVPTSNPSDLPGYKV